MKWVIILIVNMIGWSMLFYNLSTDLVNDFGLMPIPFFIGGMILSKLPEKYYRIQIRSTEDEL